MIIMFIGTVGSGKTISMTKEAYHYYKSGMKVYSNYQLNFPHTLLTKKKFDELVGDKEQLQNAVLCVDEVHIWLDSRSSMQKKNKAITYFILQTRKRNVRFLGTTQHFHQIDKRLRDTTDILVWCDNITNTTSLVGKQDAKTLIKQDYMYQWADKPVKTKVFYANPYYVLYDTTEIIDMND